MRLATATAHICVQCGEFIKKDTLYYVERGDCTCNICIDLGELYTDEIYLVNQFEGMQTRIKELEDSQS